MPFRHFVIQRFCFFSWKSKIVEWRNVEKIFVFVEFDLFLAFNTPLGVSIRNFPSDRAIFSSIRRYKVKSRFVCWMRGDFSKNQFKFRKVVYPPRMSPFGLKICGDVFQTILQQNLSQDFFGWGGIFRKKCQISEGRLPPEDVSAWLEN